MKIIDNKKDYYDYLSGIWGIDDKVVFDRRGSRVCEDAVEDMKMTFDEWGGFEVVDCYVKIGEWVYGFGKDAGSGRMVLMDKIVGGRWRERIDTSNPVEYGKFPMRKELPDDIVSMYYRIFKTNGKKDGLLYGFHRSVTISNPLLGQFDFIKKYIPPEEAWQKIYDCISKMNDKEIIDNRSDIEHLESAGFDRKTSFRNM